MGLTRAPKGQPVKARGGTPGTTPHNVLCALKGHTEPGACDPPPRLCASARDRLPFGQQMGRELLAQRRWGAEGGERVIAAFFAAWRLCLSCLSLKGMEGKSREASKPQREERLRANREVPHHKTLSDPDPPFQGFFSFQPASPGRCPGLSWVAPLGLRDEDLPEARSLPPHVVSYSSGVARRQVLESVITSSTAS